MLAARPSSRLLISPSLWSPEARVSMAKNGDLMIPHSSEEIGVVVSSSNSHTAPSPDGFSITFSKKFWHVLKELVYAVIQGFYLGTVDISRLNYVILSLIRKFKGADFIRQYRPIALINNFAKLPPKAFASRLSPVAHRVISSSQAAFIKGHFILDGILSLHEIVHNLRSRGTRNLILKLDFEKPTTLLVGISSTWCLWLRVLMVHMFIV